jgi:hypothetical protein
MKAARLPLTRAKDHLHIVVPQRFYAHQQHSNGDRHMYTEHILRLASVLKHLVIKDDCGRRGFAARFA